MAVVRELPYENSNFRVAINGNESVPFDEVILPELLFNVEEYREGNAPLQVSRKFPGRMGYSNLVLRRGFNGNLILYQWWRETGNGPQHALKDIHVFLMNEDRSAVVATWRITGAFPVRYSFTPLNGLDGSPLVETLEVCCNCIEIE